MRRSSSSRVEAQPTLDFLSPAPQTARTLKTSVQASIYCDAPVARRIDRVVAVAMDFSMVLAGFACCMAPFYLIGGSLPASTTNAVIFAGAFTLIAMFYGLIWTIAARETPGRRWAHLQLTNFDGFPPEPRQRILRFFGTCLSVGAVGIGIFWALADEENLTWPDHISQTFPTYREPDTAFVFHR
jgi:uncharacterized RDD family membrane protein YckC